MSPPSETPGPHQHVLSTWLRRSGVDLRAGEIRACVGLFLLHFLLLTFQYLAKAIRQATFIDALGAERLPWVYLLVAVCAYPALVLYGRLADRFAPRGLIALVSVLVALGTVIFWWFFDPGSAVFSLLFYVWISIVGILLVSVFWSYAGQALDPRQARRLFGFIGAGGLLGAICGGQLATWAGGAYGTASALLIAAVVLSGVALIAALCDLGAVSPAAEAALSDRLRQARDGFSQVRRSPYLRGLALLMLVSTFVAQGIDLQFSWAVERSTVALDQRTAVFGTLYTLTGVAAFVFQWLFTTRIHRRFGIGQALRILPVADGVGTALFLGAALMAPGLLLPAVWGLKIAENALRYSIDQATRELLFLPLPAGERTKAKAFIDVFVQRLGKGLAAIALLSVTFGWLSVADSAWLSLLAIGVWLFWIIGRVRRRYVALFRQGLREPGGAAGDSVELSDMATLGALIASLGSTDSRDVLRGLDLLQRHGQGRLVPPIMLRHDDSAVRCKTLEILLAEERRDATAAIAALLVDREAEVRVTATRVLAALDPHDVEQAMRERLRDGDARVRAVAVSRLARCADKELAQSAEVCLAELLSDGDPEVRCEAARALGELEEPLHRPALVRLLYDAEPVVRRAAMAAVAKRVERHGPCPLYVPILVSHLHHRKLKHGAREALVACGGEVIPALEHFLHDPQEAIWVRRALPKTIARLGGPRSATALLASLGEVDLFLRRKSIEALVALADREGLPRLDPRLIEARILAESRGYLRVFLDLQSLARDALPWQGPLLAWPSPPQGDLLLRLYADRLGHYVHNLFGLLALIHPSRDIRAAHHSLISGRRELRAHALEYLDNLLAGERRQAVFAVIDEQPVADRQREAERLFGLTATASPDVLSRLIFERRVGDVDAVALSAAALHHICEHRLLGCHDLVERAAREDPDPLVQETTAWLLPRL